MSVKPVKIRSPLKTFLKWTAIIILTPIVLFIWAGIAGLLDATPEDRARWEAERQERQAARQERAAEREEADRPESERRGEEEIPYSAPIPVIEEPPQETRPIQMIIRGLPVATRSGEVDLNARPNVRYAIAGAACRRSHQLEQWNALNDLGAPHEEYPIRGCRPLAVGQKVVIVREFHDTTANALIDFGDGRMEDVWLVAHYTLAPERYAAYIHRVEQSAD